MWFEDIEKSTTVSGNMGDIFHGAGPAGALVHANSRGGGAQFAGRQEMHPTANPALDDSDGEPMEDIEEVEVPLVGTSTVTLSEKARGKMRATTPRSSGLPQPQTPVGEVHAMTSLAAFSARNTATFTTPRSENQSHHGNVNAWLHEGFGATRAGKRPRPRSPSEDRYTGRNPLSSESPSRRKRRKRSRSRHGVSTYIAPKTLSRTVIQAAGTAASSRLEVNNAAKSPRLFIAARPETAGDAYAPSVGGSSVSRYASAVETQPAIDKASGDNTPDDKRFLPSRGRSGTVREASPAHDSSTKETTSSPYRSYDFEPVQTDRADTPTPRGEEEAIELPVRDTEGTLGTSGSTPSPGSSNGASGWSVPNPQLDSETATLPQSSDTILADMAGLRSEVRKLREELTAVKAILDARIPSTSSAGTDSGAECSHRSVATQTDVPTRANTLECPVVEVRRQGEVVTVVFR